MPDTGQTTNHLSARMLATLDWQPIPQDASSWSSWGVPDSFDPEQPGWVYVTRLRAPQLDTPSLHPERAIVGMWSWGHDAETHRDLLVAEIAEHEHDWPHELIVSAYCVNP
jgi:hypothetical protein